MNTVLPGVHQRKVRTKPPSASCSSSSATTSRRRTRSTRWRRGGGAPGQSNGRFGTEPGSVRGGSVRGGSAQGGSVRGGSAQGGTAQGDRPVAGLAGCGASGVVRIGPGTRCSHRFFGRGAVPSG